MQTLPLTHDAPETAYYIENYPYSFNLKCTKRMWIEYRSKFGYRVMEQTTNPRKSGIVWNKPHAGVYHSICVMWLDEVGHVKVDRVHSGLNFSILENFVARHGHVFIEGTMHKDLLDRTVRAAKSWEAQRNVRFTSIVSEVNPWPAKPVTI